MAGASVGVVSSLFACVLVADLKHLGFIETNLLLFFLLLLFHPSYFYLRDFAENIERQVSCLLVAAYYLSITLLLWILFLLHLV